MSKAKPLQKSDPTDTLSVGDVSAARGTLERGALAIARLPGHGNLELPIVLIHGKHPGPTIWLSGAIHGDELNGVEAIREVVQVLSPDRLSGSVIAIPVVNIYGFANRSRYTPDGKDINRSFPGGPNGSLASRIAYLFRKQVLSQCDLGIDLHTGGENRTNVPQVRGDFSDKKLLRLARAWGAPLLLHNPPSPGTLRGYAAKSGVPVLLYEAGEPHRFGHQSVRCGVGGIKRVMQTLGMYDWRLQPANEASDEYQQSQWIRAPKSGLFRRDIKIGARVKAGDYLGSVGDILCESETAIVAPITGRIIGGALGPIVHQGDALLHIASKTPKPSKKGVKKPAKTKSKKQTAPKTIKKGQAKSH